MKAARAKNHVAEDTCPAAMRILRCLLRHQAINAEIAKSFNGNAEKPQYSRKEDTEIRNVGIGREHPGQACQRFILHTPTKEHISDECQNRAEQSYTEQMRNARLIQLV